MKLTAAIDVFTKGFAATRSRTHPCIVERFGPLWLVRDAPRKNPRLERRREYVALDTTKPAEVAKLIRAGGMDGFALCVIHAGHGRRTDIEEAYKHLGFRYIIHEPIFVRQLPPVPRGRAPLPVARVVDPDIARLVAKAARRGQIAEADVTNDTAAHRLFAALDGGEAAGWVSSIRIGGGSAWVSNLYVEPSHRGRGVGGALMRCMLRDDLKRGIRHSVLTASQAGTGLYRKLKYEQIGTLQVFTPRRS